MELSSKFSAGLLGAVYLTDFIDERQKQTPIWKYETRPPYPLHWDRVARVALNPLMKLVAGGIVSHHWDWINIPDIEDYQGTWVEPNQDRFYERFNTSKLNILHHSVGHTIWGIKEAYTLGLDLAQLARQGIQADGFHYGFQVAGMDHIMKSRIVIPTDESIRLLISTQPLRILALDSDHNELPARVEGPIDRQDPKFKNLRQF